jgi:hypothetical protein
MEPAVHDRPPAIARPVAKRIERLARRAHAFHRFAHHPLCSDYADELIALGRRRRVCRGCAFALLGAVTGALLGFVFPLALWQAAPLATLSLTASVTTRRLGKLWKRALPGAGASYALACCVMQHDLWALGCALAIVAAGSTLLAAYRLRGPDRSPCLRCPERTLQVPCSGFRDIVRAERAFVRRSQRLLDSRV